MRRIIYRWLLSLPGKALSIGSGIVGTLGTLAPAYIQQKLDLAMTAENIRMGGIVLLVIAFAYVLLLWFLKPGEATSLPPTGGPVQSGSGNQLSGITGAAVHIGDVYHAPPTAPTVEERLPFPATGYSIHMVTRLADHQVARRRYLLTCWEDQAEIALFISASDVFTLCVTDRSGEEYSLQTPSGRRGVPIAEKVLLSAEVGLTGDATHLRISIDNEQVAYRTLGFAINLPQITFGNTALFTDRSGNQNGAARLYGLVTISRILTDNEKSQLFEYYCSRD